MLPEADRLEPQMRTPKSQRRGPEGGHQEGKQMIGLWRAWVGRKGGMVTSTQHVMSSGPLTFRP